MGKSLFFFLAAILMVAAGCLAGCTDRLPAAVQTHPVTFSAETATTFRRELGEYRLPLVVKRFPVARGQKVTVDVTPGNVRRTKAAPPARWNRLSFWPPDPEEVAPAPESRLPEWFTVAETNEAIVVTFSPWRYNDARGELHFLESADVRIAFNRMASVVERQAESGPLLLTSEKLRPAAEALRALHREWGFESEIVTVEQIRQADVVPGTEGLPRSGTDAGKKRYFKEKEYDEALARRTIAYLRERIAKARPRALVILGGAEHVPPSHYLYFAGRNRWLPTDQCYTGEPDCTPGTAPGIPIGRLPFSSMEDWAAYRKKIAIWNGYVREGEAGLTSLAGAAFPGQVYAGEAAALYVADRLRWTWGTAPIEKLHRTRGRFDPQSARRALAGETLRPYLLHFDHGEGNQIYFDRKVVSSPKLREATTAKSLPYVAMSIACANAAFDHALVNETLLKGDEGRETVAEALLASETGAVAYAGSVRRAMGDPDFAVDDAGNLDTYGGSYGVAMLMAFAEELAGTPGPSDKRLGDAHVAALVEYQATVATGQASERHEWSWRNFTLLGDPLLPLPRGGNKRVPGWSASSVATFPRPAAKIPFVDVKQSGHRFEARLAAESWRQVLRLTPETVISLSPREIFPRGDVRWNFEGGTFENGDFALVRWENPIFPFEERQVWIETVR